MENVNAKFTKVIYTKITDSLFPELKKKISYESLE